jgi:hypothetical protein
VSRLRPADWLAGLGGAILLGSLWLKWYGFDVGPLIRSIGSRGSVATDALRGATLFGANDHVPDITAWQAFSVLDVILALIALLAIAVPVVTAFSSGPSKPVAFSLLSSVFCALAVLLVLYRIVNQPGSNALVAVKPGAWIGFAGALIAFAGSWLALADERTPGAVPPQVPVRPAP